MTISKSAIVLLFLAFSFYLSEVTAKTTKNITKTLLARSVFTEKMIDELLMRDDINYLLYDDVLALLEQLKLEFPELIQLGSFGQTYENRSVPMITLTNTTSTNMNKTSVFLMGAHHARELSSIQVPLATILYALHSYLHNGADISQYLSNHKIYVVPAVNIDGFAYISETYLKTGNLVYKRKNQNPSYNGPYRCSKVSQGVDLNRNYDWKFGEEGSSSYPCAEDFRGPYAFSEPETRNVRDFIESKKDELKLVFSFHCYGNLFLTPFNSDWDENNTRLYEDYPEQAQIYHEIYDLSGVPEDMIIGNGMNTVLYASAGEISDWILSKYGIVSTTVELGTEDEASFDFFVEDRSVVYKIIMKNAPWVIQATKKLQTQFVIELIDTQYDGDSTLQQVYQLQNKGFADSSLDYYEFDIITHSMTIHNITNVTILSNETSDEGEQTLKCSTNEVLSSRETLTLSVTATLSKPLANYSSEVAIINIDYLQYSLDEYQSESSYTLVEFGLMEVEEEEEFFEDDYFQLIKKQKMNQLLRTVEIQENQQDTSNSQQMTLALIAVAIAFIMIAQGYLTFTKKSVQQSQGIKTFQSLGQENQVKEKLLITNV